MPLLIDPDNPLTIKHALIEGKARLAPHSSSASLDAQVLLAHTLGKNRTWLLAHPEHFLSGQERQQFETSIVQIEAGKALPYVLGHWDFYGLRFHLSPDVLIPRPETELLVDHALDWLKNQQRPMTIADVGTGSACIAIAIATHAPSSQITALDISQKALRVASSNVQQHKLENRIEVLQSDLLAAHKGPFDLICANLPYIPSGRLPKLTVFKKEPMLALDGGEDGLKLIRPLLQQAQIKLNRPGLLLAEIDENHADEVKELAASLFKNSTIEIIEDLAGKPRLLKIF